MFSFFTIRIVTISNSKRCVKTDFFFFFSQYEPKSRPTFPEIVMTLENLIATTEDEDKASTCKRQSVDPALMTSMEAIGRIGRGPRRHTTARLRSHSADARGGDSASPSDKARCHSARRVAELASRRDPHYRPMTANPFHALGGVKKILGDLFSSCLELPSLEDVRSGAVTDAPGSKFKPAQNDSIAKILERKKPNSEPSSPTARKKWEKKVRWRVGLLYGDWELGLLKNRWVFGDGRGEGMIGGEGDGKDGGGEGGEGGEIEDRQVFVDVNDNERSTELVSRRWLQRWALRVSSRIRCSAMVGNLDDGGAASPGSGAASARI